MKSFNQFQTILEAYKEPNLEKMEKRAAHYEKRSNERQKRNLERLKRDFPGMTHSSGADNQVAKDFHKARKIRNVSRDISRDPDMHALDKMSKSASNYMRGKEPKKPKPKPEHVTINLESYKDPDIKKIQNKFDKVVSTGKQTGFEYMKKGKPEQGQKIINRAVRRAHALSQVKKQFEKQPDLYALDRMAKIPVIDHKKKVSGT